MATSSSLYGVPRAKSGPKELSSSTSLAFASQLSSLVAHSADTARTSSGRPRPSRTKADIFSTHNKNALKRAAKDLGDADGAGREKRRDLGGLDDAQWHRSRRMMQEKARLYAAMKRGDYVPDGGGKNAEESALVDFDRKWAEQQQQQQEDGDQRDTSSDEGGDDDDDDEPVAAPLVEYTDEFGRQRHGTAAQVARDARRRQQGLAAADEPDRFTARPTAPSRLIYGDTIQTAAFNPDEPVAAQMEALAQRRDRSLTPPDEVHYDASAEVRTKGVAFYAFSKDGAGRRREMEQLEGERAETERRRLERVQRLDQRKAALEQRRRQIREQRGARHADHFLDALAGDLATASARDERSPAQAQVEEN
ncbi:MAG: hypothetical protein M1826_002881 [Phylliscum demangeonii]|nr:MAG: hypothetical protein M1826_002881 [Phylliscum demangeonii]